jgi:hypothetical protein
LATWIPFAPCILGKAANSHSGIISGRPSSTIVLILSLVFNVGININLNQNYSKETHMITPLINRKLQVVFQTTIKRLGMDAWDRGSGDSGSAHCH